MKRAEDLFHPWDEESEGRAVGLAEEGCLLAPADQEEELRGPDAPPGEADGVSAADSRPRASPARAGRNSPDGERSCGP
jgi:hypothetical protein